MGVERADEQVKKDTQYQFRRAVFAATMDGGIKRKKNRYKNEVDTVIGIVHHSFFSIC